MVMFNLESQRPLQKQIRTYIYDLINYSMHIYNYNFKNYNLITRTDENSKSKLISTFGVSSLSELHSFLDLNKLEDMYLKFYDIICIFFICYVSIIKFAFVKKNSII